MDADEYSNNEYSSLPANFEAKFKSSNIRVSKFCTENGLNLGCCIGRSLENCKFGICLCKQCTNFRLKVTCTTWLGLICAS